MLIWLASYRRSGNTFVRVVLNDIFGIYIKTRSLAGIGDDRVFSMRSGVLNAVGHLKSVACGDDLIEEARQSQGKPESDSNVRFYPLDAVCHRLQD